MLVAKWVVDVVAEPRNPEDILSSVKKVFRKGLSPSDKIQVMAAIQNAVTVAIAEERAVLGKVENLDKTSALLDELHEVAKRWNALSKQVVQELAEEQP